MTVDNIAVISEIVKSSGKPRLFEPGEPSFWDDPHISKGMLAAHLDPESDAASRRHVTIDKDVENLLSSGFLKPGYRVLDLGCGPGLYCSRLARKGLKMTGVDISERSLDYARRYALEHGL
jgi:2-polyprenyl-3-methyl-5-hydroxy-6-metoxy-1,4-benzoquinol methylase